MNLSDILKLLDQYFRDLGERWSIVGENNIKGVGQGKYEVPVLCQNNAKNSGTYEVNRYKNPPVTKIW